MKKNKIISREIAASFLLFLICLTAVFATSTNEVKAQEGEILAGIGFDPKLNGFGFRNFGENADYEEDLTADDMIRMFGADNVCIEGSTAKDCVSNFFLPEISLALSFKI